MNEKANKPATIVVKSDLDINIEAVAAPVPVRFVDRNARGCKRLQYRCSCGNLFVALEQDVKSGHTTSCGCKKISLLRERSTTHGESKTAEYQTWLRMKARCTNAKHPRWMDYGGRGIKVCDRWLNSFKAFLADMGRRPTPGHQLERSDNDGDYEPGNVVWATRREQARNKRSNRLIVFNGKSQCLEAWAEELGIDQGTLHWRLRQWPLERALTETSNRRTS